MRFSERRHSAYRRGIRTGRAIRPCPGHPCTTRPVPSPGRPATMSQAPQQEVIVPRVIRKTRRTRTSGSAAAATPDPAHYAALIRALGGIVYDWRPKTGRLLWIGEFTQILGYS